MNKLRTILTICIIFFMSCSMDLTDPGNFFYGNTGGNSDGNTSAGENTGGNTGSSGENTRGSTDEEDTDETIDEDTDESVDEDTSGGADEETDGGTDESTGGGADESTGGGADEESGGGADESTGGGTDEETSGGADEESGGGADESTSGGADEETSGSTDEETSGGADEETGGSADEETGGSADEVIDKSPKFNRKEVIKDMFLLHEGTPAGVPDNYGWKKRPSVSKGKDIPKGWNAGLAWGQVYADADLPNPNKDFPLVWVHIKDLEFYIYRKDGTWKLINSSENPEGAAYVEDFVDDKSKNAVINREQGGGISVQAGQGYNFHFWTGRKEIDSDTVANIAGVFAVCKARLIGTENYPTLPKHLYLVNVGGDYWERLGVTHVPGGPVVCEGIGQGRFKYATPEWQYFTMHTFTEEEAKNIIFPLE